MVEASRVQTLLIQQNDEINRLRNRIQQLEKQLEPLDVYQLREIPEDELPKDQIYAAPMVFSGNKVWPWPARGVTLYAALEGKDD
jgi:predicted nuclease with TOPRIM domain